MVRTNSHAGTRRAPDRFSGNVRSVNVVPSVALANTKACPVPATASQSIWRCQFDTSMPVTCACVPAAVPPARPSADEREGGRKECRAAETTLLSRGDDRAWAVGRGNLANGCSGAVNGA